MNIEIKQDTGYGLVSKTVTRNKNISIQAKGLYSYLCGFAGTSKQAYPSVDLIVEELNISKGTFYKYVKELQENGVITIIKTQGEKGKFGHNIYQINEISITNVKNKPTQPCIKLPHTVEWNGENENVENKPTQPCIKLPHTVTPHTVNQDTISNIYKNNNIGTYRTSKNNFIDEVIKTWNGLKDLPKIKTLNSQTKRYKNLMARVKETSEKEVLEAIKYIDRLGSWTRGQGNKKWVITLEWAVLPNNFIKLHEKHYTGGQDIDQDGQKSTVKPINNINTCNLINEDKRNELDRLLSEI